MVDDTNHGASAGREQGTGRGSRQAGGREPGGFRIRLSDNEMRAARALQEAFGLRSTVAVLGFSLRTLGQQLEDGQLEDLIQQHRSQPGSRAPGPRRGERRRDRSEPRGGFPGRGQRVDPFARPSRPAPPAEAAPGAEEQESPPSTDTPPPEEAAPEVAAVSEAPEAPTVEVAADERA